MQDRRRRSTRPHEREDRRELGQRLATEQQRELRRPASQLSEVGPDLGERRLHKPQHGASDLGRHGEHDRRHDDRPSEHGDDREVQPTALHFQPAGRISARHDDEEREEDDLDHTAGGGGQSDRRGGHGAVGAALLQIADTHRHATGVHRGEAVEE